MHTLTRAHSSQSKQTQTKRNERKQNNCDLLFELTHTHTETAATTAAVAMVNKMPLTNRQQSHDLLWSSERNVPHTNTMLLFFCFAKCIRCIFWWLFSMRAGNENSNRFFFHCIQFCALFIAGIRWIECMLAYTPSHTQMSYAKMYRLTTSDTRAAQYKHTNAKWRPIVHWFGHQKRRTFDTMACTISKSSKMPRSARQQNTHCVCVCVCVFTQPNENPLKKRFISIGMSRRQRPFVQIDQHPSMDRLLHKIHHFPFIHPSILI